MIDKVFHDSVRCGHTLRLFKEAQGQTQVKQLPTEGLLTAFNSPTCPGISGRRTASVGFSNSFDHGTPFLREPLRPVFWGTHFGKCCSSIIVRSQ